MSLRTHCGRSLCRHRAVVAVQVAITLVVLLGVAALTIDVGQLYSARTELQRAADSAALAGASAYTTDAMMRVRMETGGASLSSVQALAANRATNFSLRNGTLGEPTQVIPADIQTGWLNMESGTEPIHTSPAAKDYNAVRVMARREDGGDGGNGPVPLFFAAIFGQYAADASASAVAVYDDRVSGYNPGAPGAANLLPFTIHEDAFALELAEGGDQYGYSSGAVNHSPDGIREVRLYPYPLSGSGYTEGDGNFGTLNIGTGNQGVSAEEYQIYNGVSSADLEMEIGSPDATFYDDAGSGITYDMTGSPGLEASLKDPIADIQGKIVGFFLHSDVVLSGANATYTITAVRFGRVMDIRLTGPPNQRGFFIQPISYSGAGVEIDPDSPNTGGLVGQLVLAR